MPGYFPPAGNANFASPAINMFEAPKDTLTTFGGVKVRVGGASTIQFQALDHESGGQWTNEDGTPGALPEIGANFNLPTANPFVGNLIMDAFTTEVGAEVYYRTNGFIGILVLPTVN